MIKLEQIQGYLAYGLKVQCNAGKFILSMDDDEIFNSLESPFISIRALTEGVETRKPLLRPLSSLTKPITVEGYNEGKEFVPVEMFEIGDDDSYPYEFDSGNVKLIKSLESIAEHNSHHDVNFLPHVVVEQLKKWHFTVGIEEGDYIKIKD